MILVVTREIDMSCNITAVRRVCVCASAECYTRAPCTSHIHKTVKAVEKPARKAFISISSAFFGSANMANRNENGRCQHQKSQHKVDERNGRNGLECTTRTAVRRAGADVEEAEKTRISSTLLIYLQAKRFTRDIRFICSVCV